MHHERHNPEGFLLSLPLSTTPALPLLSPRSRRPPPRPRDRVRKGGPFAIHSRASSRGGERAPTAWHPLPLHPFSRATGSCKCLHHYDAPLPRQPLGRCRLPPPPALHPSDRRHHRPSSAAVAVLPRLLTPPPHAAASRRLLTRARPSAPSRTRPRAAARGPSPSAVGRAGAGSNGAHGLAAAVPARVSRPRSKRRFEEI
jgi:hypothetical protein